MIINYIIKYQARSEWEGGQFVGQGNDLLTY